MLDNTIYYVVHTLYCLFQPHARLARVACWIPRPPRSGGGRPLTRAATHAPRASPRKI